MDDQYTREYTAILYGPVNTISEAIINAFPQQDSRFYLAEHKQYIHQFLFENQEQPGVKLQVHLSEKAPGVHILLIIIYTAAEQVSKPYLAKLLSSFLRTLLPVLIAHKVVVKSTSVRLNMSLFVFILLVIVMIIIIIATVKSSSPVPLKF